MAGKLGVPRLVYLRPAPAEFRVRWAEPWEDVIRPIALLSAAFWLGMPTATCGQVVASDALGIWRNSGSAYMTYEWTEQGWRYIQRSGDRDPWVGATVTFADTLGTFRTGTLGSVTVTDDGYAYALPEARNLRDRDVWYRLALGYVTTMDQGHAAFLRAESPVESGAWAAFLAELRESPDGTPISVEPTLWQASLSGRHVTFFEVRKRADVRPGCPPLEYYEGVISERTGEPRVATRSSGGL